MRILDKRVSRQSLHILEYTVVGSLVWIVAAGVLHTFQPELTAMVEAIQAALGG